MRVHWQAKIVPLIFFKILFWGTGIAQVPGELKIFPRSVHEQIDTTVLEAHARFLADDLLEGRAPASRGERVAALYIVSHLLKHGLRPLPGQADYRLAVPLTSVSVIDQEARLRIIKSNPQTLYPPAFYHPGGNQHSFRDFSGRVLFAGSTPTAHQALKGFEDLRGSVVVLTPPWSGFNELSVELERRGVEGVVSVIPNATFYERLRIVRGLTRYHLPDGINDPSNQTSLPTIVAGPPMMEALGIGEEMQDKAKGSAQSLECSLEVSLPFKSKEHTGYNVAAFIEGIDPDVRDEWVVFVAHYDHVGIAEPSKGDSIWNGLVDNAAGSAMVLEIARTFAKSRPKRSVVFLWVTAEEQGLLGSHWFVHTAPVPLNRIHAVINLDGGSPPAPPVSWGIVGADASPVGGVARRIVEEHGWSVRSVGFGPQSDHWPFHLAGAPTLMLFPGDEYEGVSSAEAEALRSRWLQAHTPHDNWSPGFPLAGLGRYANLALEIGRAFAGRASE